MLSPYVPFEELDAQSRAAAGQLASIDDAQCDLGAIGAALRISQHVGWALTSALESEHLPVAPETIQSVGGLLDRVMVAYPALYTRWAKEIAGSAPESEVAETLGELSERALRALTALLGGLAASAKLEQQQVAAKGQEGALR